MAVCAQLAICCLLLSVASTQRVCRAVTTGVAAVCEATLGSNWTLECSLSSQHNATLITWRLAGRSFAHHNLSLTLTNVTHGDSGVYSCTAANVNGTFSSLRFIVRQGRAPTLLRNNNVTPGASCHNRQVVRDGVIQAMVTGYPSPAVTWFRDIRRTSRIINDSIYQLLPSGDLFVRGLVEEMQTVQDVLYVTAVNEFGVKQYCVHVQWIYRQNYQAVTVKSTEVKDLLYIGLQYYCDHYGCFCIASSPTHNLQQWQLILLGLCLGYVLLLCVIVLLAMLYYQLCYRCRHYSVHVNSEEMTDVTVETSKTDSDNFVYVIYSPQSETWVEHTLMNKLAQWQLRYTTYDMSAIPGQPKIVEKLRLCNAASKIIIVLAVDSLTEDTFLNEVLQVISSEQTKVVPVLYGVSEEELQDNMICRSITVYVSVHHTDVNFDIRLKQALT